MVDEGLVSRKLKHLREFTHRVRQALPAERASFAQDRDAQDIVAFNLIQGLQVLIDLAAHVVSDAGWGMPETYRELFALLAREGVVPQELAIKLGRAAAMRNLLVHQYGTIDQERVYDAVSGGVGDLSEGAGHILVFLGLPVADQTSEE